jgi:hypothetical protein
VGVSQIVVYWDPSILLDGKSVFRLEVP